MTATHALIQYAVSTRRGERSCNVAASDLPNVEPLRLALWTGRTMSGLAASFLLFDAAVKVLELPVAVEATTQLGYTADVIFWLGLVELVCLALYLFPRTAVLGALLWTGYLGGAVATHVRVGNPLFGQALFPVYVALLLWGGIWMRDEQLRALLPVRRPK